MPVFLAPWEVDIKSIVVKGQPWQSLWDPHLQNNHTTMDWSHGLSGRTPGLQARSPEIKSHSHHETKMKNLWNLSNDSLDTR
jgi:hypothetical protein